MSNEDASGDATASGWIRYSIADVDDEQRAIQIAGMHLDVPEFSMDDTAASGTLQAAVNAMGTWSNGTKRFSFPVNSVAISANFTIDGTSGSMTLWNTNAPLEGILDPDTDTFSFDAISFTGADTTVVLNSMSGSHTNLPPVASIDPTGILECNGSHSATVQFTGAASSDPDAYRGGYVGYYNWVVRPEGGEAQVLGGSVTQEVTLPLGSSEVGLLVFDDQGAPDGAIVPVSVEDRTAPTLVPPADIFQEACNTAGVVLDPGTPLVQDACDPDATLVATVVDINGVPADVPLSSGYQFRQGITTIEYRASDFTGNTTTAYQMVTLDFGPSCCPPGLTPMVGTSGNDDIQAGNQGQCVAGLGGDDVLGGGNQADVIFGGLGDDRVNGGNQGETVRGGVGNDVIYGGNGGDHLWGGPGNDIIYGANAKDFIRGGAGADKLYGGNGDEVFVIASACEAAPGEVIDGGAGWDRLETPITLAELQARGVIVLHIEEVVITPTLDDAECAE